MYKVIKTFVDLKDGGYRYNEGDTYPRKGIVASEARIAELSGARNRQSTPLIKKVKKNEEQAPETTHTEEQPVEASEVEEQAVEASETPETEKKPKPRGRRPKKED